MNKKIGLVIQGPLLSIGRAGNNLHATPEQIKDGGIVRFDCRDNIRRLISEYGHLFDSVVVSTWDSEVKPGDAFKGAQIVSLPDPGGIKQEGHYKDNNKFRQFLSTLNGLRELEKGGVEYAVKIRTDQYMDIKTMLDSFFAQAERHPNPNAIGVTVMHSPTFLLHDLYFVAKLEVLKKFCEAIMAYDRFEFISSVHREMILKHAYAEYREKIGVPDSAYFPVNPPDGASAATKKIFDYMFKHAYFDLDPEVFRSTLWRGSHYEKEHVAKLVEKRDPSRFKYSLPALISTDWERYFAFRKEVYGKEAGLGEKMIAQAGKAGWSLWNMARRAVRMVR